MIISSRILSAIVFAQFCCTSLWFAGNAVLADLVANFGLPVTSLEHLTSAVQFGFITGTLTFAIFTITDRFSPSRVFLVCALLGALANGLVVWPGNTLASLLFLRFLTGFFLAGIYPVGMKIAADYFDKGLGKSLGYLVGALVLGTAFPHLLKGLGEQLPWRNVLLVTSGLAVFGGLLIGLSVPDGPHRRAGQGVRAGAFLTVFRKARFRAAAFGYFGHMWELYAFWAFVPVMLLAYGASHPEVALNVPLLSFAIIGVGGVACVIGGYLSQRYGPRRVAFTALSLSGACCLLVPLVLLYAPVGLLLVFLLFWGMVVVMDSPLFSTLVAQNALAEVKGTALTIVNCIGFAITIVSIQLLGGLQQGGAGTWMYLLLGIGPCLGLIALGREAPLVS